jgi:hypothetical protein
MQAPHCTIGALTSVVYVIQALHLQRPLDAHPSIRFILAGLAFLKHLS